MFAQKDIMIYPKETYTLTLGLGVYMDGLCLVSLKQEHKERLISLQNEIIISEKEVPNIIITLQNNSDTYVTIREGDSLCFVDYHD